MYMSIHLSICVLVFGCVYNCVCISINGVAKWHTNNKRKSLEHNNNKFNDNNNYDCHYITASKHSVFHKPKYFVFPIQLYRVADRYCNQLRVVIIYKPILWQLTDLFQWQLILLFTSWFYYLKVDEKTVTIPEMIRKVKARFDRNPHRSGRKVTHALNISRERMQHILANDLGIKPLKF